MESFKIIVNDFILKKNLQKLKVIKKSFTTLIIFKSTLRIDYNLSCF